MKAPRQKLLPAGYSLAKDFADLPPIQPIRVLDRKIKQRGRLLKFRVLCPAEFDSCNDGTLTAKGSFRFRKKDGDRSRHKVRLQGSFETLPAGSVSVLTMRLDAKTRRHLLKGGRLRLKTKVRSTEVDETAVRSVRVVGKTRHGRGGK